MGGKQDAASHERFPERPYDIAPEGQNPGKFEGYRMGGD